MFLILFVCLFVFLEENKQESLVLLVIVFEDKRLRCPRSPPAVVVMFLGWTWNGSDVSSHLFGSSSPMWNWTKFFVFHLTIRTKKIKFQLLVSRRVVSSHQIRCVSPDSCYTQSTCWWFKLWLGSPGRTLGWPEHKQLSESSDGLMSSGSSLIQEVVPTVSDVCWNKIKTMWLRYLSNIYSPL